jgi:ABC-type multidrug transport system fused ATPase/permease subunit
VVVDGRIAAQGNHETLMAQSALYQELYQKQFLL